MINFEIQFASCIGALTVVIFFKDLQIVTSTTTHLKIAHHENLNKYLKKIETIL